MVPLFLPQVLALLQSKVIYYGVFSSGWDSENFWDKGTTGHVQNLAKERDSPGQPVKNLGRDNILTVYPVSSHGTKGDGAEKEKRSSKTKMDVLKQERIF